MGILITAFNEILYRPLFNSLVFLYNIIPGHDFGLAIIVLTLIIRSVLYPLNQKAIRTQKALTELQPKIKEIQKKYKDREEQAQAMLELYRSAKINPFSGFLPILIQLPILIALYKVFLGGINQDGVSNLYSFISRPENINPMFLGLINLSQRNGILALLAGFFQYIQTKMIPSSQKSIKTRKTDFSSIMGKKMTYFMPVITFFIAWSLPSALALYWIVITLFSIFQQWHIKN